MPTNFESLPFDHTKKTAYTADFEMKNPGISATDNLMMMQEGYNTKKTTIHKLTADDLDIINDEYCESPLELRNDYLGSVAHINKSTLKKLNTIDFSVHYTGAGLGLQFSKEQLDSLDKNGRMILEANNELREQLTLWVPYSSMFEEGYTPEWAYYYETLAWPNNKVTRYPYNTIYVSSDLLLHSYHKLFENTLKEYETTHAREQLRSIVQESLDQFYELARTSETDTIKSYYEYLTAYWSVASILIPETSEFDRIIRDSRTAYDEDWNNTIIDPNGTITTEYLKEYLQTRTDTIIENYPTSYTDAVQDTIDLILEWTESKHIDTLADAFSPQDDPEFMIYQDYTQFVPRGYYTDNAELKTYFMTLKWLMRHKFYTRDTKLARASLLLVHKLPESVVHKLSELNQFIKRMIGEDDDITRDAMQEFLQNKDLTSTTAIFEQDPSTRQEDLSTLHPQKIISTSYLVPEEASITEKQSKFKTAGFVLFGEKFTSDSRVMDELTAGWAEVESSKKPSVVSIYQLRDTIALGNRLQEVQERWNKFSREFGISQKQQEFYTSNRNEISDTLEEFMKTDTIYNKRLILANSARTLPKKAPEYMTSSNFVNKIKNTILWTYTELKHDTILYVKQAFAEMGAWWPDLCRINVEVPELDVPKWYVEPQVDLIDNILILAKDSQAYFWDTNKVNFELFIDYLQFVKSIALKQLANEVITDQEFERLRTSYTLLSNILSPSQGYRSTGERGTRSANIADIFTSGDYGPYYLATGRPLLMIVLVDDINGKRAVIWPVYSTYEFYGMPFPSETGRYTDQDRRDVYDNLEHKEELMTLPLQKILIPNKN